MAQGDVGVRVGADTTGLQAGMIQAAVVTEAQMKKIAQMVKAANDETARLGKTSQTAASQVRAAHESIADGAKKVESAHAGVNRELLVLAHEMSQGNYSRFGGSLLVLAERTNFLSFALSGTGALISAVGAAVLGTAALVAMGAIEQDKFNKALQLTGNYAAITEAQVRSLAEAQSKQTGQTVGASRESIQAIAGTGLFGPQEVAAAARAMGDYQRLTHSTSEDAVKEFAAIQNGVAKWAEETNKSVHFLTSAEFEHIKSLEGSGSKQQAAVEALSLYAQTIESRALPQVGALSNAFHGAADSASFLSEAIKNLGRGTTSEDVIGGLQRDIDVLQSQRGAPGATSRYQSAIDAHIASIQEQQRQLRQLGFRESERAGAASANAGLQQAAIESDKYIDSVLKSAKALSQRTEELKKWDAEVAKRAAAGNPLSAQEVAAGRAEINKRFQDQGVITAANEYANLMASVKAFNATTDEEVSRMAKLTDGQKFSIQAHEELTKAGKKLSDQQRSVITSAIDEAAAHRTVADMLLAAQKASIARVIADTADQEQQRKSVEGVIQAGNDQANAILRQSQMIGRSADEVLKVQELAKFDDLVGKALLGANGDTVKEINQVAAVIHGNLVAAINAAKATQDEWNASFDNGWHKAAEDFARQAANSAAFGEKMFVDATNGMTDALAKFAETGKLSFKGLIDTMISDLIRFEIQQQEAKFFGGAKGSGGSAALGLLGSFGGASSGATGSFADLFSGEFGGGFYANGLDYVPYDGFPAVLHEGERVTSRQDAAVERSSRGTPKIDMSGMHFTFGAGVNAPEVAQAVRTGMAQVKGEIFRAFATGRV